MLTSGVLTISGRHLIPAARARLFCSAPVLPCHLPGHVSELIWAELKDAGPVVRKGEFPVILVCNAEPVIRLDPDVDPDAGG